MARSRENKIELTAYDDLFQTDESRAEAGLSKIRDIPISEMQYNDATPSLAQAIKMRKFHQDGKLTDEVIQSIMEEEKPNQKEKPVFRDERITKLIPKSVPRGQEADFVVKALEYYNRHLQRNKAHER